MKEEDVDWPTLHQYRKNDDSQHTRRSPNRRAPQVYVFPNLEDPSPTGEYSILNNGGVKISTTRMPYPHEKPFYYIEEPVNTHGHYFGKEMLVVEG